MPDHDMRTLLRDLADSPEPASTVDLTAARRTGKRRLWLRNGSITAAVAIVVAVAVVIPGELAAPAPRPTQRPPGRRTTSTHSYRTRRSATCRQGTRSSRRPAD